MKKINKKKVILLIFLILMVVIEIIAFRNSKAENVIEVTAVIKDNSGLLEDATCVLNATNGDESGYYILLPSFINGKKVKEYHIEEKQIQSSNIENENKVEKNSQNEIEEISNNLINNLETDENSKTNTNTNLNENETQDQETTSKENKVVKQEGEKVFLTEEEIKNKEITLVVEYDKKENRGNTIYYKQLEQTTENHTIKIEGYMPLNAEIKVEKVKNEQVQEKAKGFIDEGLSVKVAYDIKILSDGKEYEPEDFDENVQVTIKGIEKEDFQQYKIIHIDDKTNEIEEINEIQQREDTVIFNATRFSTYAVLLEDANLYAATAASLSDGADLWDGNSEQEYTFGEGSETNPYLITTGAELKYLQSQVNAGNSYENKYFQLANDINLNGKNWVPIGDTNNSFKGVFDGAGHIISNAIIRVTTLPASEILSYGIFGSIGNGSQYTIIKNLELDSIQVSIDAGGTTGNNNTEKGYHIGTLVGTMYNKSEIVNVIVKNSEIMDTDVITIRTYGTQFFVGGIVGCATNTPTSDSDPGNGNRYAIENCFSNVNINLDTERYEPWWGTVTSDALFHTGGVIGTIRSQPVWPSNCLYVGEINSIAFAGPIFAALLGNTSYTNRNNYATLWNGNDAGNLTTDNAYYNSYRVNGTNFTTTVTTGTSTSRISSSSSNIGYVQGVNKGQYTNNISNLLSTFNNYAGNEYMSWVYENGTFSLNTRFTAYIEDVDKPVYRVMTENAYSNGPYTYDWYINGEEDTSLKDKNSYTKEKSFDEEYKVKVLVGDGEYYAVAVYTITRLSLYIDFNVNTTSDYVIASLDGEALPYINLSDYTYQWYSLDISGLNETLLEGETNVRLNDLQDGVEYKLIATNNSNSKLTVEGTFVYGDRTVIYVDYDNGNNNNDGYTPETAVRTMQSGYSKLSSSGTMTSNIIVLMGNYTDTAFLNSATSTNYSKNASITGAYGGVNYNARLSFEGENSYRYATADTAFHYLTFNGGTSGWGGTSPGSVYFYMQGYSLTMGEGIVMENYTTANTNQGLITGNAPAFHVICGWLRYNYAKLPRNNPEILIKSGTYGRIILGGSPGTNAVSNLNNTTSRNFTGSSFDDMFNITVTVDIQNSTTPSNYTYDINLLVGGSACGNTYANVTENIKAGNIGRVLGASIGDTSNRPNNWNYPINTFLGTATINITGGNITELYGGCLGRNMSALTGSSSLICDSYFYGTINVNISGGTVSSNIYGAGAGGVTGYSNTSSDSYKRYGENVDTDVNINVTGGVINGNIYGGGYGYTEYLTANVTAVDGGALYGNSNINITGGTINGNIYGAGCGSDNVRNKESLAQCEGITKIKIEGNPSITGNVYGSGMGISGMEEMAKLTGTSNIDINTDLNISVFGGGNIAKTVGETVINVNSGNHTQDIYGGGNLGNVDGETKVYIKGGTSQDIYAGGRSSNATKTNIYLRGGQVETVYGGSNITGNVQNSNVEMTLGTVNTLYGGNNVGGTNQNSNIIINGGTITSAIYGGGNHVDTGISNVDLKKSANTIPNIYGGGNEAGVSETNVHCNGAAIENVFGGSNTNGTVPISKVYINQGRILNAYGGNNHGGATQNANVIINGGATTNIYGGGEKANTTESHITFLNGIATNVYGGGNEAGVNISNIETSGGCIENVFGGSNTSGNVETSNITTKESQVTSQGLTMNVKVKASKTESWQSTTYPTIATINIQFKNTSKSSINTWNANLFIQDSTMSSNYSQSEITEKDDNYSLNEKNKHYGTNPIPAGGSYSVEFTVLSMQSVDDFNYIYSITGTDTNGNNVSDSDRYIKKVYGGNNQGGKTNTSNLNIQGGGVINVYGGGNQADTNTTNIIIDGNVEGSVFGGGNLAGVDTDTDINILSGTIKDNVYGGGNEGTVNGNTYVHVKDAILNNSVYAGGNGIAAIVYGNTNLTIDGSASIQNNAFGGGNKAATGTEASKTSISTVNIAGGTIGKNVYGGANTSVVYGVTKTNIGYDTIGDTSLERSAIDIGGTVFGGGEANEAGDENYDFSFISVTNGIDIQIDGNGYDEFKIDGSIFGSGNASSTSGESFITIKNYGTPDDPRSNISIQRTNRLTLTNSAISLSGATDRTNEYSSTYFSFSRVDEVKLKNNSTLYLNCGANLLKKFYSLVDINGTEELATVTINGEDGSTTKNVDNRIYMLEGKNLNIATNEQVTAYGEVYGMTFFGLFTNKTNPSTSTGLYNHTYQNGDTITNLGTFSSNSYVMAAHKPNHNTAADGFYTNYNEEGNVKVKYIETTPEEDVYYMWLVGEKMDVTVFEFSLTASKYATLGTYELSLTGFSNPNIRFVLSGFSAGLNSGISLVDPSTIDAIAPDEDIANSVFGLTMKSGNNGWKTKGNTTFLTTTGGSYTGTHEYSADNSSYTPTFNFCFYHSQNINIEQALGDIKIRLQVITPIDDLNYKISYIDINITLATALYQNDFFEAAITPGEEFGLFTTTETSITNKSTFSTYYSLYIPEFSTTDYHEDYSTYERVLVSRAYDNTPYIFPADTKITMLDMVTNKYYYYNVTTEDESAGKFEYKLSDFIAMGTTNEKFNSEAASNIYYNTDQDLIYENYIFHIDLEQSNITQNISNNRILMELRDTENQTLIGVLGIQRDIMVYSVYTSHDSTIDVQATIDPETLYLGNSTNLNISTNFLQNIVDSKTIYDTQYFEKKMGIKLTIYDINGNQLNSDTLLGVKFILDGKEYYPRIDGTTRIKIADKVSNVLSKIKIDTSNNKILSTGTYTIKIESFGSPDGIYYGLESSDNTSIQLTIVNSSYGLKATTGDKYKIVDKETGFTLNGSNSVITTLKYTSGLENPNIAYSLYRRNYSDDIYSQNYHKVDLKDYVTNILTPTKREKEYVLTTNPLPSNNYYLYLKDNLVTGTYRIVYKLYDGDNYIGEVYEYIIIK